jgi:maleylacetate reductase
MALIIGMRAVDHASEALCCVAPHPEEYDEFATTALKQLLPGLLEVKQKPSLEAYTKCQMGAWNSIKSAIAPVSVQLGASHAIGHKLGGVFGVDHGKTSCVMLPAVMKWNAVVNSGRQFCIVGVFRESGIFDTLEKEGLPTTDAGDLLKGYVNQLGMPGSLSEVGVGEADWSLLAKETMTDPWTKTNPRKINGPEELMEIFELAK